MRVLLIAIIVSAWCSRAAAEELTTAIQAYLQQSLEDRSDTIGFVVGLVDNQGSRVIAWGSLGNGTDQAIDGDTVFEIGSDTKTFTALLLQDMVERGEMHLDDPVATYLPASIAMPTRNGREITLRHLATHTSGLPNVPDNVDARRADNPYAEYTVEKLYAFLSSYELTRDPGAQSEYSNLGMGLLSHAIARKAGSDYESLVVDRICRPLQMHSTRITLRPELRSRFVTPHNQFGEPVPHWDAPVLAGAGALRSTANDLLKYVSANLGLTRSRLTPLMDQTHDSRLAWVVTTDAAGSTIVYHGGGTGGCRSFPAFDKARRRGVVLLTNSKDIIDLEELGLFLLKCEWHSERRPTAIRISSDVSAGYQGQYQRIPAAASRAVAVWRSVQTIARAVVCSLAGCGLAALGVCAWQAKRARRRVAILAGALLLTGIAAAVVLIPRVRAPAAGPERLEIRLEGNRLFVQAADERQPGDALLPPDMGELLPQSNTRFFERLSGARFDFVRDVRGNAIHLTARCSDDAQVYERISDQPPVAVVPLQPRVPLMLHEQRLDAFVGTYEFPPSAVYPEGIQARIWRDGEQLLWQERGRNALPGTIEIYPESPTTFFTKIDAARLIFDESSSGEVTAVRLQIEGSPDLRGERHSR